MIDCYIIALDSQGETVNKLKTSILRTGSELAPHVLPATTPDTIADHLGELSAFDSTKYRWNWPESSKDNKLDMASGLFKKAYAAADQRKVEACLVSHMRCWDKCVVDEKPIVVFEADAILTRKFEHTMMLQQLLVGLNDPRGATRKSSVYHNKLSRHVGINPVPVVNDPHEDPTPQGLAGNSAYYITPVAAKALLDAVQTFGGWPNDAIMCRELFPWLKVAYPYFTKVQGTNSTTTS